MRPAPPADRSDAQGAALRRAPRAGDSEHIVADLRRKVYARSVSGLYARWRVALVFLTQAVFYGLPWLEWNGRQAVLFDLGARKFYLFGIVLWPQDIIYLTVLLVIAALSLFLFTAIAGRLFCGYACPQTVYSEIFMWIERRVEGDRLARIRLDESPWTARKVRIKAVKHALWLSVAAWTGFTFVGYFVPIRTLGGQLLAGTAGFWPVFWMGFYGFATWGNAGFLREQVCKYMCPYARFQSVMVDQDTYVVTYDAGRGEPRGHRSRSADPAALGLGDCVDCSLCVQVCPTGIDIRDGLQYMCIGCGACIDACDTVMAKMQYPKGLIRYTTERGVRERLAPSAVRRKVWRPRVIVYGALLLALAVALGAGLALRPTLRMDVMRDRGMLAREVPGGFIENVYRVLIINASESPAALRLGAQGLEGLEVVRIEGGGDRLAVPASSNRLVPVVLRLPAGAAEPGTHEIEFTLEPIGQAGSPAGLVREASSFIVPQ
jgi:cytochrome c oxidase accessory protein FixG